LPVESEVKAIGNTLAWWPKTLYHHYSN